MRLRREDNERAPGAVALSDPAVGEEDFLLLQDDLRFVRSVTRLAAADGLGASRVNGELETEDCLADASFVEDVPILLDHDFDFAPRSQSNMITDADVFLEFRFVTGTVPKVDVGA